MINNFLIWLDVIKGNRPRHHLWQALNNLSGRKDRTITSPWGETYKRYSEETFLYFGCAEISYPDWLSKHYWDELNLDDLDEYVND
jgi:hypothetical protein